MRAMSNVVPVQPSGIAAMTQAQRMAMIRDGGSIAAARGARISTATRLGTIIEFRGYRAVDVQFATGIHARILTEYLAGRKRIPPRHLALLAELLGVNAEDIQPPETNTETGP